MDVEHIDDPTRLFAVVQPDVVINCVGLVKQLAEADDPRQHSDQCAFAAPFGLAV